MIRKVIILPRAESQLLEAAIWWCEHRSREQALHWLAGFERALASLERDTRRLTIAPENAANDFSFKLRQLTYGLGSRPTHRALVEVRDAVIYVHSIRHLAQSDLSPDEL